MKVLNQIPAELYDAPIEKFHSILRGPTLIHLGKELETQPIFFSILLHGNEHSGPLAMQTILKKIRSGDIKLKRPLILFIGNTLAAQHGLRHLPEQLDYNRVWSGGSCEQAQVAQKVLSYVSQFSLFCSVDIHNNTGRNPYYSCLNKLDDSFLFLAQHFFDKTVYFTEPHEVLSMAFARLCPSVTLEVGQSGEEPGLSFLVQKLEVLLGLHEMPTTVDRPNVNLFHSIGRMYLAKSSSLDFEFSSNGDNDFSFKKNVDEYNFEEVAVGSEFAYSKSLEGFWVEGLQGDDLTNKYFEVSNGKLTTKAILIPAMITQNPSIIKDDCFGYIMERYQL